MAGAATRIAGSSGSWAHAALPPDAATGRVSWLSTGSVPGDDEDDVCAGPSGYRAAQPNRRSAGVSPCRAFAWVPSGAPNEQMALLAL